MIAGVEVTAYTLTYLIWSVCRHSAIKDELLSQLRTLPSGYTESHLRDISYLDYLINETLRLYPITPTGLPRDVPPRGWKLAGYQVDGGVTVSAQAHSMHRNPAVFPQPNAFVPSRWADQTPAMKESYMPWGKGSRVCIGQGLTTSELRIAVARFFLTFPEAKVSTIGGMSDQDMEPAIHLDLAPSGGRCFIEAV